MSHAAPDSTCSSLNLRRRHFISTAMLAGAGMTADLVPNVHATFDAVVVPTLAELLPKPADSLAHYTELYLARIELTILRAYFVIVGSLVCELKTKYEKLLKDTIQLEDLVPQLKANSAVSQIKDMTDLGRTSAIELKELAQAGVASISSPNLVIAHSLISLKNSVADWNQQGPIMLQGPALALLRSIIRQIKELDPLVKNLSDASALLTDRDNKIKTSIAGIRKKLEEAVSDLVEADNLKFPVPLLPPPPEMLKNLQKTKPPSGGKAAIDRLTVSAVSFITQAIADLKILDGLRPTSSPLPDPFSSVMVTDPKCLNTTGVPEPFLLEPTLNLRELLQMVMDWIHKGGLSAPAQQPAVSRDTTMSFVGASFEPSVAIFGSGMWYRIRWVLQWFLPKDSRGRALYCSIHIIPVLFNPDPGKRYRKIYQILPDLIPKSIANLYDPANDGIRQVAATEFSKIRP